MKEVCNIAQKKYADLTAEQKAKRKAYSKARQARINAAAREAGVIGAPRPKMSDAERKAKRKIYSKAYRKTVQAQARAYRDLVARGKA